MSKIFAIFFVNVWLFANINFDYKYKFELKKDEVARIEFREKSTQIVENFDFYWTLYDNTNLILHTKFRKFPRQIVLSLRHGLELYKQQIFPNFRVYDDTGVEIYLEFLKFENARAILEAKIIDGAKRVDVRFIGKKGSK